MEAQKELRDVEDTRPLPGIEWDLKINRELANRFGANAQTIGTAVQLVTNGIMVGKYRPDDSDDEVDIRVRYPAADARRSCARQSAPDHAPGRGADQQFRHAACRPSRSLPSSAWTATASITCAPT